MKRVRQVENISFEIGHTEAKAMQRANETLEKLGPLTHESVEKKEK